MIIGRFKQTGNDYKGSINTLGMNVAGVIFEARSSADNGPDYAIRTESGTELGVAWNRTGEKKGTAYVSASLYSPFLSGPVYVALFESKDKGGYDLVWNEPRPKKKDAA
jgi:uncharacterized protein (DUF736 family)